MSNDDHFRFNMIEGLSQFSSARTKAFWKEMINLLRGKPVELLSFDEIRERLRLREESYRGLQDIPLDQIAGSVGRYREFTRDFLPKNQKMKERWSRVYAQATSMEGLPPIEVYKVGELYFVRDGNHRVSVARQLGAKFIEAHVTELPTNIELHPAMSEDEIEDAAAYAAFLEESQIAQVRPHHKPLKLSERSRYADLLGHIYLHKSILEFMAGRELNVEEASIHWYDNVYRPALTLIQKYNMMQYLDPERTETDLYLWLVDHLREVRDQFGEEAPSKKFSDALVDFLKERNMDIPDELKRENDDSMILSRTQIMKAIEDLKAKENEQKDKDEDEDST